MKKTMAILLTVLLLSCAGCAKQTRHVIWRPSETVERSAPSEAEQTQSTQPTQPPLQDDGLEYAIFPMEYLMITQTSGEGTHLCNWAVDFAGEDTGIDDFYAPFTLRVVRLQEGYGIVWAQSVDKVHLANGGLDYVTLLLEHCDDIDDLYVGQVVKQGEVFYTEGTAGNATGNHVHAEFAIGPYVNEGSFHAEDGHVAINNGVPANEVLFLTKSTQVTDEGGFTWQSLPLDTQEIVKNGYRCQGEGHLPQDEEIIQEPSCTRDGLCRYTCQLCGCTVTRPLPATGHTVAKEESDYADQEGCHLLRCTCTSCNAKWWEPEWTTPPTCEFSDVPDAQQPYVGYACENGLMAAFDEDGFLPDGYISRVELLEILYDRWGTAGYGCDYSDVDDDDPEVPIIGWATAMGLASATEGERFAPSAAVTRLDAVQMVTGVMEPLRFVESTGLSAWAVEVGLFSPTDNLDCPLTRGEAAKLLTIMQLYPTME